MRVSHVALLRGINVGGKNRLPMKDLVALFEALGCSSVQTYIQSGNVIFEASAAVAAKLPLKLSAAIVNAHGLRVPVVLRTVDELQRVGRRNPFLKAGVLLDTLHVAFLAEVPSASAASALDPKRSPPDEVAIRGRELYLRLPNGVAATKFTNAYFDKVLGTTSTLRNWRTTLQLIELCKS